MENLDTTKDVVDEEEEVEEGTTTSGAFVSSVNLVNLLNKEKFVDFRKQVNLPTDLEDTDDLEVMVKLAGDGNNGKKSMCKNLFNFISCLAGESLDISGMTTLDQYQNFYIKFVMWIENMHVKEEFKTGILKLFPGRKLPDYFEAHVAAMKCTPTSTWIKANGARMLSPEQLRNAKFGCTIKAAFDACKRDINGFANPLWIPPQKLPSGVSVYGYNYFMRRQLWPVRAQELAANSVKQAFLRDNKNEKYVKKDHFGAIVERAQQSPFDKLWYPEYWLSFLFLGMPAGDNVRDSFKSGKAALTTGSLEDIRSLSKKRNRRAIDEAEQGLSSSDTTGDGPPSSERKRNSQSLDVRTLHVHAIKVFTVICNKLFEYDMAS
jgi:hypothetical protein